MSKKFLFVLVTIVFFCGLLIQLIGAGDSIIFKVFTWDRSISRFFNPRLEIINTGIGGASSSEIDTFFQTYFFYNFSNSYKDYNLIINLIEKEEKLPEFPDNSSKDGSKRFTYSFLWNNIFNSSRTLIPEVETQTGVLRVGLFVLSVRYYPNEYYFEHIHEWNKLNNWGEKINFTKVADSLIETDSDCFDFIFWTQAEHFLDKEIPDRMGKKIRFYNDKKRIVEFDYSSGKGYKVKL